MMFRTTFRMTLRMMFIMTIKTGGFKGGSKEDFEGDFEGYFKGSLRGYLTLFIPQVGQLCHLNFFYNLCFYGYSFLNSFNLDKLDLIYKCQWSSDSQCQYNHFEH